jgi:hypothetical protein
MSHRHPPAPSPELIAAYRRARYRIAAPTGDILLRLDAADPGVVALFAQAQAPWAVFITAYQPFSHPVSEEENAARQTELLAWAIARGLSWLDGEGGPPEGTDATWAPEPSRFLFIDAPAAIADTLMLNFVVLCNAQVFCTLRWHPCLPF